MSEYSFLFLGKQDDAYCERALKFLQANVTDLTYCLGKWGDPLPEAARDWEGDWGVGAATTKTSVDLPEARGAASQPCRSTAVS